MKNNGFFYLGVALSVVGFLMALTSGIASGGDIVSSDGTVYEADEGLTAFGKAAMWGAPILSAILIGLAFWLRHKGKKTAATILVWIMAFPILISLLIGGGLMALFVLGGR